LAKRLPLINRAGNDQKMIQESALRPQREPVLSLVPFVRSGHLASACKKAGTLGGKGGEYAYQESTGGKEGLGGL